MLKLSSSRGIRIDVPVLSVSWSFEDHSVKIQALRIGLIEHEASDTGGVPRWKSSCPDRLAEATVRAYFSLDFSYNSSTKNLFHQTMSSALLMSMVLEIPTLYLDKIIGYGVVL